MNCTRAWCLAACLLGTAALGQDRPADGRIRAIQDARQAPVNRFPDQSAVQALIGQSDTRQDLNKVANLREFQAKNLMALLSSESAGKQSLLGRDAGLRNLSPVSNQLRDRPGKDAFIPDPSLRTNRLSLPPQASSYMRDPDPGRFLTPSTLKLPEAGKQFFRDPDPGRFATGPVMKVPEPSK
jgi:hypothetical protein